MANEAQFSVSGFVATQPTGGTTKGGSKTLSMRVGWTPRVLDKTTGEWNDQASSFVSVQCYRKVAEHASACLRKGDPVVLRGTLRIREYVDPTGARRNFPEVAAEFLGHDLSRGITTFTRTSAPTEPTADELAALERAATIREPLPGDRPGPGPDEDEAGYAEAADLDPDSDPDFSSGRSGDLESGDLEAGRELVLTGPETFDAEAARLLGSGQGASEPVGASA